MTIRNAVLGCAVLAVLASAGPAAEVPAGTHVLLRMMNSISTRTARPGDYVYLETASPITAEGRIVVPRGSYVQGVVTHSKRSGRVAGRAELGIRLDTITLPGGGSARFSPHLASVDSDHTTQQISRDENTVKQGGTRGRDAGQVAIYAGRGAAVGGIADRSWRGAGIGSGIGGAVGLATVLATRGREVDLRRGSSMDVVFDRPLTID